MTYYWIPWHLSNPLKLVPSPRGLLEDHESYGRAQQARHVITLCGNYLHKAVECSLYIILHLDKVVIK